MGFRRRTRRRAVVAGAAIAHREDNQQQQTYAPAPAEAYEGEPQVTPPPADPADQVEHLAELHASGALTDDEFAAAKARFLGS